MGKRIALYFAFLSVSVALSGVAAPVVTRLGEGCLIAGFTDGGTLWAVTSIALERWDIAQRSLKDTKPFSAIPNLARFSPKPGKLALAFADQTVSVIELFGETEIAVFSWEGNEISSLAISLDGSLVAAGDEDGRIVVWETRRRIPITKLQAVGKPVRFLTFSPDGLFLAAAFELDDRLFVYSLPDGEPVGKFPWNRWGIRCADFSPGSELLAIGAGDGTVRLWDLKGKRLLHAPKVGPFPIEHVSFASGEDLWILDSAGRFFRWGKEAGILEELFSLDLDGRYVTLCPPDFLVGHPPTGPITIRHITAQNEAVVLGAGRYKGRFTSCSFSPEGDFLAAGSAEGHLYVWGVDSEEEIVSLKAHDGSIDAVRFSEGLILTGGNDGLARIWSLAPEGVNKILEVAAHPKPISDVDFSPDGRYFLTASVDETVRLWDTNGDLIATFWKPVAVEALRPLIHDAIYAARFSPDGNLIAAGSEDKTVRLWEVNTGKLLDALRGHNGTVTYVEFSPDGRFLASAGDEGKVIVWDVKKRRPLKLLQKGGSPVFSLAFSPNGEYLVVGDREGGVRVFSLRTGKVAAEYRGHVGAVYGVAFHPEMPWFATASSDGTVVIWNLEEIVKRGLRN